MFFMLYRDIVHLNCLCRPTYYICVHARYLKIYSKPISLVLPFKNTKRSHPQCQSKLNTSMNKRVKCALANSKVYMYTSIGLFISSSDCTFSSFQWHVLWKGQNIAKPHFSKTHPSYYRLSVYHYLANTTFINTPWFLKLGLTLQIVTHNPIWHN